MTYGGRAPLWVGAPAHAAAALMAAGGAAA